MAVTSITPFLWFDQEAEEAASFYVSLFDNSRITHVARNPDVTPGPTGSVLVVNFELDGRPFIALNGGPYQKLSEAFSISVGCTEQRDIDRLWAQLGEGGSYNVCGWLTDRFGLSWQINYAGLADLMVDPAKCERVMAEVMRMTKFDIQAVVDAANAG